MRFREHPPLFFDLEADPYEQRSLVGCATGDAKSALSMLRILAETSIDFGEAEKERLERDGDLRKQYAHNLPPSTGNLYIMPSGKLVNADDVLYNPTVISGNAADVFADWPGDD